MVGLLRPIVDFYCHELNDAMAGIGTDEDVLIEILCTLSNQEIHIIKNQYLRCKLIIGVERGGGVYIRSLHLNKII